MAAVVFVLAAAVIVVLNWWADQSKGFTPIPPGVEFISSSASRHFTVEGIVALRHSEPGRRRLVTFEVRVENRTDAAISHLLVTAELPGTLAAYGAGQLLTFGQMDPMDLVPGKVPYGLIVTREQALPDPYSLSAAERSRFYEALKQPIRVGLWWRGGEEYLTLDPEDIKYVAFPGLDE